MPWILDIVETIELHFEKEPPEETINRGPFCVAGLEEGSSERPRLPTSLNQIASLVRDLVLARDLALGLDLLLETGGIDLALVLGAGRTVSPSEVLPPKATCKRSGLGFKGTVTVVTRRLIRHVSICGDHLFSLTKVRLFNLRLLLFIRNLYDLLFWVIDGDFLSEDRGIFPRVEVLHLRLNCPNIRI